MYILKNSTCAHRPALVLCPYDYRQKKESRAGHETEWVNYPFKEPFGWEYRNTLVRCRWAGMMFLEAPRSVDKNLEWSLHKWENHFGFQDLNQNKSITHPTRRSPFPLESETGARVFHFTHRIWDDGWVCLDLIRGCRRQTITHLSSLMCLLDFLKSKQ